MAGPVVRRHSLMTILGIFLSLPISAGSQPSALVAWVEIPGIVDGIAPEQLAEIERAIAAYEKKKGARVEKEGPFLYPFYPQAGILGRDLFLLNFTDQDPSTGLVRDWDCSDFTYDGHQGHDSSIRSFREQAIGVPVFAARDGIVVETHDGESDMSTAEDPRARANLVAVDHGDGYYGWYLHLKKGSVAVSPGQHVTAGTQLGLTGSSGRSTGPHLHFETHKDDRWIEPSAGPCRSGDSLWLSQPPVVRDFYVADFFMTRGELSIPDAETFLLDEAERTGTFLKGPQTVSVRADLRNLPGSSTYRLRVLTPRGQLVYEAGGLSGNAAAEHISLALFAFEIDLNAPGTWRVMAEINGEVVVNTPFRVVASPRQLKNRPPNKITARLSPSKPVEGEVLTCEVQTSLITEDPDFDIVGYRYEWRVNNRVVRSVTSAALTDLLAAGTAKPKDRVSCRVVPGDRKSLGKASEAVAILDERY